MTHHSKSLFLGLITVLIAGLFTIPAFATEFHLQAQNVSSQIAYIPKFSGLIAYVIGTFFSVRALFALKGFIQDPDENPINRFIGFSLVGALLIILPFIVEMTSNTILDGNVAELGSGKDSFSSKGASSCIVDSTVGAIFCNLAIQFQPFAALLAVIAYVMAAVIALMGFMSLKEYGDDPSSVPVRSIVMKFVLAALLLALPLVMQTFITTVTGETTATDAPLKKRPAPYKGSIRD